MLVILLNLRLIVEKYCQDHEDELKDDILTLKIGKSFIQLRTSLLPFYKLLFLPRETLALLILLSL